jgi:hypothetical protein
MCERARGQQKWQSCLFFAAGKAVRTGLAKIDARSIGLLRRNEVGRIGCGQLAVSATDIACQKHNALYVARVIEEMKTNLQVGS